MKKIVHIAIGFLLAGAIARAQNPQTQNAPLIPENAQYVNGVAPGYYPTAGSGLVLNVGPGTANCLATIVTYGGGTLSLTGSATNRIYLNTASSCAPATKTSAFSASDIPLATVVTGSASIISITDDRSPFFESQSGASGCTGNACITGIAITPLSVNGVPGSGTGPIVNVLNYGCVGNGSTSDQSCLNAVAAAATSGMKIYLPAGYTFVQTAQLTINAGVTVQLDGKLQEEITGQSVGNTGLLCSGSCTVTGSGTFAYNEDGSTYSAGITVSNGVIDISGVTFTSPNSATRLRYSIQILQSGTQTISSFHVHEIHTNGVEYGIIRATSTTSDVAQALIENNIFYDHTGDPVEWNVGPLDGSLSILNNSINYVHSTLSNEGLGIGVAGEGPYAYPQSNPQQYVLVEGNNLTHLVQGIHFELIYQGKIDGNLLTNVNPIAGSTLDNAAIEVEGSFDTTIDSNTVTESTGGIIAGDGSISSLYVPSTENLVIENNYLLNTNPAAPSEILIVVGRSPSNSIVTEPANVVVRGNVLRNAAINEAGVNTLTLSDNDVVAPTGTPGLKLQYYGYLTSPSIEYNVTFAGNRVRDLLGNVYVSIEGLSDYNAQFGFYGNIRVFGGHNSFSLVPTLAGGGGPVSGYQFYPEGDSYLYSGATFPPGINFQVGDKIESNTAGISWIVTGAGSLGVSSDTFTVSSTSPCILINSGSNNWGEVHTFGQLVTVSDGTHTFSGAVGSTNYASSAFHMTLLSPTTGAPLVCTALGSGSITATSTVTYQTAGFSAGGDLGGTPSSQTVLGLTHVTNANIPVPVGAPILVGNSSGVITFTALAAMGTGGSFSAPTCYTVGSPAPQCTQMSGLVVFTTGTAPTSGAMFNINDGGSNRTNGAACVIGAGSIPTIFYGPFFNGSNNTILAQVSFATAPVLNSTYIVSYFCGS